MREFPLYSLKSRNKSGNGGSNVFSGSSVLPGGGRAKEADIAEARRNECGEVPDPSALGDAHKEATKLKEPIDLLFIDADKEGYTDYLKKLLPLVRPGGLIVAHNISMRGGRSGIPEYVKAVTTNPNLETIFYGQGGGVSVTLKKR